MSRIGWALVGLGLSLSGCAKHSFVLEPAGMAGPPDYQRWHSALLWGMVELDETDARHVCEGRTVAAVHDRQNVANWLVTALASGIYQASTVRVWCGDESSAQTR